MSHQFNNYLASEKTVLFWSEQKSHYLKLLVEKVLFIKLDMFSWFNLNYVFMNSPTLELLLIKLVKQECCYVNNNSIFSATEKAAIKTKQQFLKYSLLHKMLNLIWSYLHGIGMPLIVKKLKSLPFNNYPIIPGNVI